MDTKLTSDARTEIAPAADSYGVLSDFARNDALVIHSQWRQSLANAHRSDLESLAMMLIQKRAVDGYYGRRWDAGAHLWWEKATVLMLETIKSSQNTCPTCKV